MPNNIYKHTIILTNKIKVSIIINMNKIREFIKTNQMAIKWSIAYVIVMWAVLRGLFNFRMFSITDWTRLAHAHLHGFAGLVFGILLLAAVPLYIATTTIIVRTKKPIFAIKLPSFLTIKKSADKPKDDDAEKKSNDTAANAPTENPPALPQSMPPELKESFIRARNKIGRPSTSAISDTAINNTMAPAPAPTAIDTPMQTAPKAPKNEPAATVTATPATTDTNEAFPLPDNFDFDDSASPQNASPFASAPVFSEINFGNDEKVAPETTAPKPDVTQGANNEKITQYLDSKSIAYTIENDIVITDKHAIATHDDKDFWIADDETWFATGVARPSPVAAVKNAAAAHGLHPVLYLAQSNIMDLDTRRDAWRADGILVITDPSELG